MITAMFPESKVTEIYCMADDFCKEFTLMLETVLKILFVVAGYIVIRQIPLLRSIYGISVSLKKAFNK